MLKLGFCVNNLFTSQLAYYLLRNSNQYIKRNPQDNLVIFYENLAPVCIRPELSLMNIEEIFAFDGILIATNVTNAQKVINAPGPTKKLFYVWDLEWLRLKAPFRAFCNVYRNQELQLVARSHEYKKVLEDCWNLTNIPVVDDFNIEQFKRIINEVN